MKKNILGLVYFLGGMIIVFCGAVSSAEGTRGGGNARVCFDSEGTVKKILKLRKVEDSDVSHVVSVEILDLYEATHPVSTSSDLTGTSLPAIVQLHQREGADQYIDRVTRRFSTVIPSLPRRLTEARKDLKRKIGFPHGLDFIRDVGPGEVFNEPKCAKVTIIGQYIKGENHYIGFDERFFSLPDSIHSKLSKVVSALHEYVYFMAREDRNWRTSDTARILVANMITNNKTANEVFTAYQAITDKTSEDYSLNFITLWDQKISESVKLNFTDHFWIESGLFRAHDSFVAECQLKRDQINQQILHFYMSQIRPQLLLTPQIRPGELAILDSEYQKVLRAGYFRFSGNIFRICSSSGPGHFGYDPNPSEFHPGLGIYGLGSDSTFEFTLPNAE